MPKNIRLPNASPFEKKEPKDGKLPPYYGEVPTNSEIAAKIEAQMAAAMFTPGDPEDPEDDLNKEIDERKLFMESMMDFLPIFKKFNQLKDPESILQMAGPIAARTLIHCMVFGDNKTRESSASKVLDRVMGKPVERQISLMGDIHKMTEEEVDSDIARILQKLPEEEVRKLLGGRRVDIQEGAAQGGAIEGISVRRNED